jgi:3,4-dihydroxy 2-butanone 4-phosphate synthase
MRELMGLSLSDIKMDLLNGKPIVMYDFKGREEETDMVFYGGTVTWESINILRRDAGGLICYVTGSEEANEIGLKFLTDEWRDHPIYSKLIKRPAYGDYPSFTIWVNHINVGTGINDIDRAKTIRELHKLIEMKDGNKMNYFLNNFYAPGHVPVLASRGLENRKGHTELVTALADKLNLPRSMVIAEMLDNGKSLSREKAEKLAKARDLKFIEGEDLVKGLV